LERGMTAPSASVSTAGRSRGLLNALAVAVAAAACVPVGFGVDTEAGSPATDGHLLSRPPKTAIAATTQPAGAQAIGLDSGRDGVIYVPEGLSGPAPLFVLLHGATGNAAGITRRTDAFKLADELKVVILAPDSRERTWDMVRGHYGPDVAFLDKALAKVFERVSIDRKRVAVGGFSDGASYAIGLGLQNGDLFTHIAAFSPGFYVANQRRGRPLFWVSHGRRDEILPIDNCSRRIVPELEGAGYLVRYKEFDGPHTVPPELAREAFQWIAGKSAR
jgi:phospholipase/carboxylesterase